MTKNAFCGWSARGSNRHATKMLLVMKLTFLLLTAAFLNASATGFSQSITFSGKNVPLEKVFTEIKKQTGYHIIYNNNTLVGTKPVTINAQNTPLLDFLETLLKDQPLTSSIASKTIILTRKTATPALSETPASPPAALAVPPLTGVVRGQDGQALAGASVRVKGAITGVTTNTQGKFTIHVNEGDVLVISFVGFVSREVKVTNAMLSSREFVMVLQSSDSKLQDVEVVNKGYYTESKRLSTGSVGVITAQDIEKQPVTNVLDALEGRIPGLLISQTSGQPGAGVSVNIRATGSLLSGTLPLYIVDGVPFVAEPLYTAGGNNTRNMTPSYGNSPLNMMNPSDIESISVLKDADATAIYGSRGANGVILITTKRGKIGKTGLEVNVSTGMSSVPELHRVKTMTLSQYLQVRRTAYANAGVTPTATNAPDLKVWDTTKATDWQKLLFGGTAHTTDASISLSGGTAQTNFLLSGTYHKEGQVIPGDYNYQRGAFHLAVNHQSMDHKLGVNVSVNYGLDQNNSSARPFQTVDLGGVAYSTAPNMPLYDSTGKNLYWFNSSLLPYINPLSYTFVRYSANTNNLVSNITLRYSPLPGLNLKASSSYNRAMLYQQNLNYTKSYSPYSGTKPSSYSQENYTTSWNFEPQADYTRNISQGRLNLLAGGTFQGSTYNQPYYIYAGNFTSDYLLTNFTSGGNYYLLSFNSAYKYSSFFGRFNYNWKDKYILNASYREDASSKFAVDKRTGGFWSVGGAWIFSSEPVVQNNLPWLSFGKIRSSYGKTGNDQISNYQFYDTYTTSGNAYDGVVALYPTLAPNPQLTWEINRKFEIAMDLGLLKDRIAMSAAWFTSETPNPLVSYPLANLSGFSYYTANMKATIQSRGPEFELNTQNIKSRDFSWNTSFNISFPQNKLVSFPDILRTSYISTRIVGESLSSIHLYKYTGISPTTSLPTFLDGNKDGISNYPESGLAAYGQGDYVTVGKSDPAFFGGFSNTFRYKEFQLDVFVQFVGKKMVPGIDNSQYTTYPTPGYYPVNLSADYYKLFQQTNGKIATTTFSFTAGSPYLAQYMYAQSSATISNAAYARLKNVSFSYTLPSELRKRMKMSNCIIYARAQNLFTVTKFTGYDPESAASDIPPFRTMTFGIKCSF